MGHTGGWAYAPVASGDTPRGTPMRGQGVHVLKDIPGVYTTVPKEYVAAQSKLIPYIRDTFMGRVLVGVAVLST